MSDTTPPGHAGPWPVLDVQERRVLGVLVEKQKTLGPEAYPMSLNAMVTGCNQKSNRDPIMDLEEDDVEEALMRCKNRGFAAKVIGGRVERWRHLLYENWHVDKVEMAILGELLLRGPQTEGELRTRASRMDPIDDLDALRNKLGPLVERKLVVYLTAEDRRGAMLTHGFHSPQELAHLKARQAAAPPPAPAPVRMPTSMPAALSHAPTPSPAPAPAPRVDSQEVTTLKQELTSLQGELRSTKERMAGMERTLGELRDALAKLRLDLDSLKQALGA